MHRPSPERPRCTTSRISCGPEMLLSSAHIGLAVPGCAGHRRDNQYRPLQRALRSVPAPVGLSCAKPDRRSVVEPVDSSPFIAGRSSGEAGARDLSVLCAD